MNLKQRKQALHLELREDTWDHGIVDEVNYQQPNYAPDDVWLDLGGNIGMFGMLYSQEVKKIISYEPDPSNFQTMMRHYELNGCTNVIGVEAGVVGNDDTERSFYLASRNKGLHSFYSKRTKNNAPREEIRVRCQNINEAIKQWKPNKLKIDIEGAEWEILPQIEDWSTIEEVVMELHFGKEQRIKNEDGNHILDMQIYNGLIDLFTRNGFTVKNGVPSVKSRDHNFHAVRE